MHSVNLQILIEYVICHAIVILLKGFSVDHISSLLFGSVDFQTIFPSSSGASNIKLAMGKWLILQVKSNILQRLSLAFVDAHGIARFHWELDPGVNICLYFLRLLRERFSIFKDSGEDFVHKET